MKLHKALIKNAVQDIEESSDLPASTKVFLFSLIQDGLPDRIIRPKDIPAVTGLSLSTIERREKDGSFPRRRKLSDYAVGWSWREDIQPWMNTGRR